jgi:predicted NodU family carbamoyl transferase
MKTKILGVNLGLHTSICQMTDGKIDFFYDEDRCTRTKKVYHKYFQKCVYSNEPVEFESIKRHVKNIDRVIYASYGDITSNFDEKMIENLQTQLNEPEYAFYKDQHHLYHALCGFHLSNMSDAVVIVMDGGGAPRFPNYAYWQEIESIYYISKDTIQELYKHLSNVRFLDLKNIMPLPQALRQRIDNIDVKFSSEQSCGYQFSKLTEELNLGSGSEAGKTMGLAAYGNLTGNRPEDKARQLQEKTRIHTIELIKKAISYGNCKNIILSGGYALNCTNNYLYLSEFPDCNFFVDPVAHDGGTAIGAAELGFRMLRKNNE